MTWRCGRRNLGCLGELDHQAGTLTSSLAVQARRLASDRHRLILERRKLSRHSSWRGQFPAHEDQPVAHLTTKSVTFSTASLPAPQGSLVCTGLLRLMTWISNVRVCDTQQARASNTPFGICCAELAGSARRGTWLCFTWSRLRCW